MALPIIPIAIGAWKIINIAGNVIFFGSLGKMALDKYNKYKSKGKTEEEIAEEKRIQSRESIQDIIDKAKQ